MKMNSDKSIETGRKVYRLFGGNWEKARQSATVSDDGVLVIRRPSAKQPVKEKQSDS